MKKKVFLMFLFFIGTFLLLNVCDVNAASINHVLEGAAECEDIIDAEVWDFLQQVFNVIKYAGPLLCIVFSAIVNTMPAIFNQQIIAHIEEWYVSRDWASAKLDILPKILTLAILYIVSLVSGVVHTQLMAIITQGFLSKSRMKMFSGMQNLPIKYFDTNKHGDIMSHYTNDIDTLRQLVSQSIPAIIQAGLIVITVFFIMLWYSIWMTLVVVAGVFFLFLATSHGHTNG